MKTLLDTIGNTPLVQLQKLSPNANVKILAKLEGANPGGSVKDRAAYWMIKGALDRGEISAKTKIIEATSGNTGIALAMIAGLYGLNIELVMPESATRERMLMMKSYGAKISLTPREKFMEGAIDYVNENLESGGYFSLNQFANPDNVSAHYDTTGPEIWRDTNGTVTHFVSAMGTTGTIIGVSSYLKEQTNDVKIIGVHPAAGSSIPGIKRWPREYLPKIFDESKVDETFDITQEEAVETARLLVEREGILTGISAGGACAVALKVAKKLNSGTIVFIACDRGERYLTSGIFGN